MKLARWIWTLLAFRVAVLVARALLPLGFPDIWRQSDTLGVAMRYWSRWALEPGATHVLLPAVLNSGDTQGIMPMEFPLLNLWGAPFFALGPYFGRVALGIGLSLLVLALTAINARVWKSARVAGISAYAAMLLLPIASFSLSWSGKFMPDYVSMILVTLAIGLSWERSRPLLSGLLGTLGILMKPPSVIVYALWLAHEQRWRHWRRVLPWVVVSVGISLFYYTWGVRSIARYQELPPMFALPLRPPLESVYAFFVLSFRTLVEVLLYKCFFPGGILLVPGIAIWARGKGEHRLSPLWWILALQILGVAALDGPHALIHVYYFLGVTPVACLLLVEAWESAHLSWLRAILVLGILVPVIEASMMDLKPLYKHPHQSIWDLDRQCADLIARNPALPWRQGKIFRSTDEPFPSLGLCFGERERSKIAEFGFFWKDAPQPTGCQKLDESTDLILAKCVNSQ